MKKIFFILVFIIIGYKFIFPYYGFVQHVFAEQTVTDLNHLRGSNLFTNQGTINDILNVFHQNPYVSPSKLVTSDDKKIIILAKQITVGKNTDEEKSKAIYFWVTHHITYDVTELSSDFFLHHYRYRSASETLKINKGLCLDFATVNAALHRAVGIQAKVVHSEDHAWNEIYLNGNWIPQDTTFGSGYIYEGTNKFVASYDEKYFNHVDVKKTGEFLW